MRLSIVKKKSRRIKEFSDKEWAVADIEHFGKPSRWKEKDFFITAVEKKEIVGLLHYNLKAGILEVTTLIVSHTLRNKGIGSRLMKKAEEIARKQKVHKMFLLTGKGWKATSFYEKAGFKQTGELKRHYLKRDWVIYSKLLP